MADPSARPSIAKALAARIGADDLLVFIPDREVGVLLPAPGFPQTLPNGKAWQEFLRACAREPFHRAQLFFPTESSRVMATGLAAEDGSVLILLGGEPKHAEALDLCLLLPLLAAAFHGELTANISQGQAALARQTENQGRLLVASLEKTRAELRHALADAQRANAEKDRFLAVLSHELRTPLNPVLMAASALEGDSNLSAEVRADLAMIRRNVQLEAHLIDDLLDLTRIAKGKVQLRRKTVDAHELLEEATATVRADSPVQPRITLDLAARQHHINADPARLQQVFWNLIKNAVKFTPLNGQVTIRTRNDPEQLLRVEVIDTGKGIAASVLPTIFDAFEQGDPAISRRFGGLGLGLAISKALVEMHAGAIRAESDGPERGARFIVQLEAVPGERLLPAEKVSPLPAGAYRRRILLVEDHQATAELMLRLLRKRGHEVELAQTKSHALALGQARNFDVVISDLALPDGNGYEVMESLGGQPRLIGIALSGFGMEADIERSLQAGFSFHLTKPIDSQKLYETIEGAARSHLKIQTENCPKAGQSSSSSSTAHTE